MRLCLFFVMAATAFAADDPYAAELFQKHCASCHNSEAGASGRVPQISALKSMTPAAIQKTIDSGIMKQQAAALSAGGRQRGARKSRICVRRARRQPKVQHGPAGEAVSPIPGSNRRKMRDSAPKTCPG